MGSLVSQDQTCGVPGCSCRWNLLLLRDVLDWVDERNLPLALVSIDQEKVFDRVQYGFLFGVLWRMGFGPRFMSWLHMLYRGVYSCVKINGFLSGAVEQAGGVRQGCPLSLLLYVLYMEPFAELVRHDTGVDGVRIPGVAGALLKIEQYADGTTLFVSSARSLVRVCTLIDTFGAGTGSQVNFKKSSVLFCGRWTEDVGDYSGFSRCQDGLKILGVWFYPRGSAEHNWETCLALVQACLWMWSKRRMSLSDVLSPAYQAVVCFLHQCPSPLARDDLRHRVPYGGLAFRQIVAPSGVLLGIDWGKISGGSAPGMVRDIQWRCTLGRLPVRERGQNTLRFSAGEKEDLMQRWCRRMAEDPLLKGFSVQMLWNTNYRVITVRMYNPFVSEAAVTRFLQRYCEVKAHRLVLDDLGVWTGNRQFQVLLKVKEEYDLLDEDEEDPDEGENLHHPPATFNIGPDR
ncbi:hypothetical protein SKAU_G00245110 [Synaphobranchus kaupii]|uniref:Reverse transcriptase domain-containing protein n=1 Tax=Synaphobranchus kaupii TaxID=118154 RepID=A0A9Q1F1S6_SYNKA|nr:hypothetical protein SKAU_G00245110 [Synaphobranchus kaupii]